MSLHEVILARLRDFDILFTEHGMWSGEEYAAIVAPLHQALLVLAEKGIVAQNENTGS